MAGDGGGPTKLSEQRWRQPNDQRRRRHVQA